MKSLQTLVSTNDKERSGRLKRIAGDKALLAIAVFGRDYSRCPLAYPLAFGVWIWVLQCWVAGATNTYASVLSSPFRVLSKIPPGRIMPGAALDSQANRIPVGAASHGGDDHTAPATRSRGKP